MLPALPRVLAPSQLPPTQSRAPGARAQGGCAASLEAGAGCKTSCRRMLRRGARRPPQSTRARIPQKFGSGSVGSEMQPKPHSSEPRANKHAQARTQTSPRLALAASGLGWPPAGPGREGRAQAREGSPSTSRSLRGGRSASAAHRRDVSARRHRPGLTVQRPAWACNSGVPVGLERPPERPVHCIRLLRSFALKRLEGCRVPQLPGPWWLRARSADSAVDLGPEKSDGGSDKGKATAKRGLAVSA
ncbi:hypothetical protein H8959_017935 [Pygathrix nigripes]